MKKYNFEVPKRWKWLFSLYVSQITPMKFPGIQSLPIHWINTIKIINLETLYKLKSHLKLNFFVIRLLHIT